MKNQANFYAPLAVRTDFNRIVRHITGVLKLFEDVSPTFNLADKINELINAREFDPSQTQAAVSVVLKDKWQYSSRSKNLLRAPTSAKSIIQEMQKWKGVDVVFGYHHPDLGFLAINPKNPISADLIEGFRKNELLLVYVGLQSADAVIDKKLAEGVLNTIDSLLEGKQATVPAAALKGKFAYIEKKAAPTETKRRAPSRRAVQRTTTTASQTSAAPSPQPAPAAPKLAAAPVGGRMSHLISVVVSNELFHNGNVEAWKRIIRSYNIRYPNVEVIVFYEGERIVDINTLFKWGKVKHGSCIQFAVAGEDYKDLSKLSKYFREGASPRFEAFLHGSPDTVLNLF